MSVYTFLEAFDKLEKHLKDGGSPAARGHLTIHDIRSKLDKFIKALGPSEIQVCIFIFKFDFYCPSVHLYNLTLV